MTEEESNRCGKAAWDEYRKLLVEIGQANFAMYQMEWEEIGRPLQFIWKNVAIKVLLTYQSSRN